MIKLPIQLPIQLPSTPMEHRATCLATQSRRQGFTMIELLAASTLTAMMMVFVLGSVSGLTVRQKELEKSDRSPSWKNRLVEQLRWDLTNAEIVEVQANRLLLTGFGGRDWKTGNPTQRRTEIVYEVKLTNNHGRLMRHETHVDELTNTNRRSDLMALGIASIAAVFPDEITTEGTPVWRVRYPNAVRVLIRDVAGQMVIQEELRWR